MMLGRGRVKWPCLRHDHGGHSIYVWPETGERCPVAMLLIRLFTVFHGLLAIIINCLTFSLYGDDILVVRKDEDLDPIHLAALCTFAKDQLSPRLAGVTFSHDLEKPITIMSIARGNWGQFFENYRKTATLDGLIRGFYGILQ
ncbi:hypothetical protein EV356DRAFT_108985 [Viridothelium virens]|uniref:Uncharacterized protein n=1 Tax=Viridothelium virens TaxID=1048519 RepID=A0A6A6HNN0_VIRVR|nr:hypothetical protein EV356DRAFT_108985 [Viridothelium virens]